MGGIAISGSDKVFCLRGIQRCLFHPNGQMRTLLLQEQLQLLR